MCLSHHDDASRLLHRAHAHDGGHADGGALEVNAAVRGQRTGLGAEHTKFSGSNVIF